MTVDGITFYPLRHIGNFSLFMLVLILHWIDDSSEIYDVSSYSSSSLKFPIKSDIFDEESSLFYYYLILSS